MTLERFHYELHLQYVYMEYQILLDDKIRELTRVINIISQKYIGSFMTYLIETQDMLNLTILLEISPDGYDTHLFVFDFLCRRLVMVNAYLKMFDFFFISKL